MAPTKRCYYSAAFRRKAVLHAKKTSNLQVQREFGMKKKECTMMAQTTGRTVQLCSMQHGVHWTKKQRTTVMLCCTADGRKLPPYIIFKRKTLPAGEKFPRNVVVRVHDKGWMCSGLMEDWVKTVWERRPGAALCKHSLLVLDSYRGHLTDNVKTALSRAGTDIAIIPGGMTSQLQPLDVAINKPFKDRLRKHYTDWLTSEDHQFTPTGRIKRASLGQLADWIAAAWNEIPDEAIIRAFKKCCISNAMDGSEDDALWDELSNKEDSDVADEDDNDDNE